MSQAREKLEQVFREEYGRIIATLIRISGSFDLAEEALQEAFISAASKWELEGSPNNPGAWLTTVVIDDYSTHSVATKLTLTNKQRSLSKRLDYSHTSSLNCLEKQWNILTIVCV